MSHTPTLSEDASHAEIVAALTSRWPEHRVAPSLGRIAALTELLGDPQRAYPVVHVTGTNGKGSTAAMIESLLRANGLRTGRFSSPHVTSVTERIAIDGQPLSESRFDDVFREIAPYVDLVDAQQIDGVALTFFEIITAMAYAAFADAPVDVAVIEVGLGGTWDATNVADGDVAVITPIDIDHAHLLGSTIAEIATEKAGIIKRNVPVIVAAQQRDALAAIERQAARMSAPMRIAGEDFTATEERGRLVYQDDNGLLDLPPPRLYGRHQYENAGLAIATLRVQDRFRIPHAAYETGIARAEWPARMNRLTHGALVDLAPAGSEVWLDGGHNPDGGRAIAATFADLEERVSRPLVMICGMLTSKDCEGFLRNFTGLARRMIAIPVPGVEKSMSTEALADCARGIGLSATSRDNIAEAFDAVRKLDLDPPPRVLITGSLYLAGEVLKQNGTLPQ